MGEGVDALTAFFAWCGFVDGSVYLSPAPLYHAAPIAWSMAIQRRAGTVVLMERFDAEQALALIERYSVTCGQFVPTMFVRMLKLPQETRAVLRPVEPAIGRPRGGAVPRRREAADDRLVGADHLRVLLVDRGRGRDVHRARGVAGAPGHGRQADGRGGARPRRRRQRASDRRTGHAVVRGRARLRVPQRPGRRRRRP